MHSEVKYLTKEEIAARFKAQEDFCTYKIFKERNVNQQVKWGWQTWDGYEWLTILAEEFGEIAKAILEHNHDEITKELEQVAAVCCAMYEQHTTDQSLA